jgi:hypothetical protein
MRQMRNFLAASSCAGAMWALFLLSSIAATSSGVDDLYVSRTLVTGQTEANRHPALLRCLTDVLVKISGDPKLFEDPAVTALDLQLGNLVRQYRYRDLLAGIPVHDEQGTRDRPYELTATFHPEKIDAALQQLGRRPWTGPRPKLVAFVHVRLGATSFALTSDGSRGPGMREALAEAGWRAGVSLTMPDESSLANSIPELTKGLPADLADLDSAARMMGGDIALAGLLDWSEQTLGWVARWHLAAPGKAHEWQVKGVNFDDAFRSATRGAAQILSGNGQPD